MIATTAVVLALATGACGYALGNRGGGTLTVRSDAASTAAGSGAGRDEPAIAPVGPQTIDGVSSSGFGVNSGSYGGSNGTKLISRRTAAGLEIRSSVSNYPTMEISNAAGLPPECNPTGNLMYAIVTDDDLAQNIVGTTAATRPIVTLSATAGMAGDQTLAVIVTGVSAVTVSATFPNGTVDSMGPVNQTVILASTASTADLNKWAATKITFTTADGSTQDVTPDVVMVPIPGDDAVQPHIDCTPRLPAAGEQPADPAAAKAAVVDSFTKLYDPTVPDSEKIGLVDDPAGVQAAWDAARTGSYADAAKTSEFKLVDLVFTAQDEASVKYDIILPAGSTPVGSLTGQIGTAKLIGGTWKVSHDTICGVLSMAGGGCGGNPDQPTVTFSSSSSGGGFAVPDQPPATAK